MKYLLALPITALMAGLAFAQEVPPPPPVDGIDVQARGVVHEAYADTGAVRNSPGVLITKVPPKSIEEMPPEDKPAGDNIIWIAGYWGWEEEAADFVWVSGFWRASPPGKSWMPGYWQKVPTGYQWVSGYWSVPTATEVQYLPTPPETLERGPTTPAPVGNFNYVPGMWVWQTNRFLWRPGYHLAFRPGWVWVSGCYRWTPCGFVHVPGYWDVPMLERGMLFAPVRIQPRVYLRAGFVYRPAFVVQPDFLVGALFVRPGRPAYYFGDYFEARYRPNYTPWATYRPYRAVVDVNFGYYRHSYAKYTGWDRGVVGLYTARYAGDVPRPPRTLVAQTTLLNTYTTRRTGNVVVNKTVNITNVQNVTALQPLRGTTTFRSTGLTSLATARPVGLAPVVREVKIERVSKDRLAVERAAITRNHALATHRVTHTTTLIAKTPPKGPTAAVRVKVELPRGTPPPRVIKTTIVAPPPPTRPKTMMPPPKSGK